MSDTKHVLSDQFKQAIDEALHKDSPAAILQILQKRMGFRPAADAVYAAVKNYLRSKGHDV